MIVCMVMAHHDVCMYTYVCFSQSQHGSYMYLRVFLVKVKDVCIMSIIYDDRIYDDFHTRIHNKYDNQYLSKMVWFYFYL